MRDWWVGHGHLEALMIPVEILCVIAIILFVGTVIYNAVRVSQLERDVEELRMELFRRTVNESGQKRTS